MSRKIKIILGVVVSVIIIVLVIIFSTHKTTDIDKHESTIDSLNTAINKEESIVDSFYVKRDSLQGKRDSMLVVIDTLRLDGLINVFQKNIKEYEKNINH